MAAKIILMGWVSAWTWWMKACQNTCWTLTLDMILSLICVEIKTYLLLIKIKSRTTTAALVLREKDLALPVRKAVPSVKIVMHHVISAWNKVVRRVSEGGTPDFLLHVVNTPTDRVDDH